VIMKPDLQEIIFYYHVVDGRVSYIAPDSR
jgi:hypothetical protein